MPQVNLDDTIAAVATPPGEGGIAVVRLSGEAAFSIVNRFFHSGKTGALEDAPSHTIHHGRFIDEKGKTIDEVLVSIFRAPRSYTGENTAEISCHGGIRVTRQILEALLRGGARYAEPGEFTRRAFLNQKLDLAQAEAVLDLIRSRSDRSLETALGQLQGKLSEKIHCLKDSLLKIQAHLEAGLDFPDERLETDSSETLLKRFVETEEEIRSFISSFRRGSVLREGVLTVIVGRPNVGKSSLLNALLEKDRALVSPFPGTTRDALEETVEIGGVAVRLVDTAGLGVTPKDELDQMGAERTRRYLREGDLLLFVADGSSEWTSEDEAVFSELDGKALLPVVNKADLPQKLNVEKWQGRFSEKPCWISSLTGKGFPQLEQRIEQKIREMGIVQESLTLTRLRHKQAFEKSLEAILRAKESFQKNQSAEIVLVDLKEGIDALRELIGELYSEDLLDVIFQEFCIGK
jgi:tRNA modification GTPase